MVSTLGALILSKLKYIFLKLRDLFHQVVTFSDLVSDFICTKRESE